MKTKPKVFCVGFQKTGTTSLFAALSELGYRTAAVIGRDLSAAELQKNGGKLCVETARNFDAVQDMPWPLFYQDLDSAYPKSKFILTVRDAESWFGSIEKHFGSEPSTMQEFIYGEEAMFPAGNKERYLQVYNSHNQQIRDYFADRPNDLLVMDLAKGDGWSALCEFLEYDKPIKMPFPAKNKATDRESLAYRLRRKITRMLGGYLSPEEI